VLQVVGRRVDISPQGDWGERAPFTRIVVIGAAGSLDPIALEERFAACVSTATLVPWGMKAEQRSVRNKRI
jgi:Cobalamin synthesis protein cobW C-terminal domain